MIHLFCGFDERERIGYHTFASGVLRRASLGVSITKLDECGLGQVGTNAFTLSRFLVPIMMRHQGRAIFCDASDQVMLGDLAELDALFDPRFAVQVVKHPEYATKHPTKYIGTDMECPNINYARKNWASVMLMNCAHPAWQRWLPEHLHDAKIRDLLQFRFLEDEEIGELPNEWNRLVDEGHPMEGSKIMHWTAGIPWFEHYRHAPGADVWRSEARAAGFTL